MSTKTISITDEAYSRLASRKKGNESFSEVINRITGKGSILRFAGILNKKQADLLRADIEEGRKLSRERTARGF